MEQDIFPAPSLCAEQYAVTFNIFYYTNKNITLPVQLIWNILCIWFLY